MVVPAHLADIWPTDNNATTWTDSDGFTFKLINWTLAPDGWGCTYCMNMDPSQSDFAVGDLIFVDANEWPWVDHGQNHPAFMHMRHFNMVSRRAINAARLATGYDSDQLLGTE